MQQRQLQQFVFPTLLEIFKTHHERLAIQDGNFSLSFGQLQGVLENLLLHQQLAALPEKSKIGFLMETRWEFFPLLLWAWNRKMVIVPLSLQFPQQQLQERIEKFSLDLVITDHPQLLTGEKQKGNFTLLTVQEIFQMDKLAVGNKNLEGLGKEWDLQQNASLTFTSGSTGNAKAVLHTLGNFFYSAWGTNQFYSLNPGETWFLNLPLNHVGGLLIFIRTFLAGGCTLLPSQAFSTSSLQKLIEGIKNWSPQFLSMVPTQFIRLLKIPDLLPYLQSAKAILLGGGPIPSWCLEEGREKGIPLSPTYGLTETCSQVSALLPKDFLHSHGKEFSSGGPLPYRQIEITGQHEILVKGPTLFKAYIDQDGHLEYPFDEEDRFPTHDLGEIDQENNLHVWGRGDQIFISGGENIHPYTVEACLKKIPQVLEAIVVPIPHPEFGQVPLAFLELEPSSSPTLSEIHNFLQDRLPSYMIPKNYLFLPLHPGKGEIKYKRYELQQYALNLQRPKKEKEKEKENREGTT